MENGFDRVSKPFQIRSLKMHVRYAFNPMRCEVQNILQHKSRNVRILLRLDVIEVSILDIVQDEGRPEIFLDVADLDIVKLNAFDVPEEKPVGGKFTEHRRLR